MNTDKIYAESIAKEYAKKDDSKVIALRKLDCRAKMPATIFTYTFGIILISVNYPIYKKMLDSGKKKYAYDIMKLAKEITEE